MNIENLIKSWKNEEEYAFEGWDFSHIKGRWESEFLPWNYKEIVCNYIKEDSVLLDMGTGGGEFLLSLNHNPKITSVTEGYLPNYDLCRAVLSPLGIEVEYVEEDDKLNFEDSKFDIVINRHESFDINEVYRILKPGGYFITQQIGGKNDVDLSKKLIDNFEPPFLDHVPEVVIPKMEEIGFEILEKEEMFSPIRFFDTGALVYFAKIIEWEFPGFSVESCRDKLLEINNEIEKNGYIEGTEHRYLVLGKKI